MQPSWRRLLPDCLLIRSGCGVDDVNAPGFKHINDCSPLFAQMSRGLGPVERYGRSGQGQAARKVAIEQLRF